jgi:hypothetical protein
MTESQSIEWKNILKAAIWKCLEDESTRDETLESIIYTNMENYVEFRELQKYTKELEKKLKK